MTSTIRISQAPSIGTLERIWRSISYMFGMLGLHIFPRPILPLGPRDNEAAPGKGGNAGPLQLANDTQPQPYEEVHRTEIYKKRAFSLRTAR